MRRTWLSISKVLLSYWVIGMTVFAFARAAAADEFYGDLYIGPANRIIDGLDVYGSIFNHGLVLIGVNPELWAQQRVENHLSIEMYKSGCWGNGGFKNYASGTIKGYGLIGSDTSVENSGTITSLGGSLTLISLTGGVSNFGVLTASPGTTLTVVTRMPEVRNQGTIEASLNGTVVFDCNLVNEAAAVVKLNGGALAAKRITQARGATLQGFGGISGNLIIDPNAVVTLIGPTQIVGDVQVSKGGKLEARNGTTFITGQVTGGGTIYIKDGNVVPLGGFSSDCIVIRESGT